MRSMSVDLIGVIRTMVCVGRSIVPVWGLHADLAVAGRFGERSVDSFAAFEVQLERRRGEQLVDIVPFEVDHAGRGRIERDSTSVQRFDLAREPIAVLEPRDVALTVRGRADRERYDEKGTSKMAIGPSLVAGPFDRSAFHRMSSLV